MEPLSNISYRPLSFDVSNFNYATVRSTDVLYGNISNRARVAEYPYSELEQRDRMDKHNVLSFFYEEVRMTLPIANDYKWSWVKEFVSYQETTGQVSYLSNQFNLSNSVSLKTPVAYVNLYLLSPTRE